jgi:multicomponent Na+:H+ antiporter subunit F
MTFVQFSIGAGVAMLLMMIPAIYRIIAGPTALDRIVAVNVIGTKTAVVLVIIGVIYGKVEMFVDFALAYALLNFTGSIAAARFLHRTKELGDSDGATPPEEEVLS